MWSVGETRTLATLVITREQIVKYAGASGDYNPIHYDDERARSFGLPGIIAHGMLNMGLVAQALLSNSPPGARLERYGVRFRQVVQPGQTVTITGTLTSMEQYAQETRAEFSVMAGTHPETPAITGQGALVWPHSSEE